MMASDDEPEEVSRMIEKLDLLTAARTEALFVSSLSAWTEPGPAAVAAAISDSIRAYGGVRNCAAEVAAAYGDYPEGSVARMRWARRMVAAAYPDRPAPDSIARTRAAA
jgi:hypothetical protein